jgi:hypothetical protein
VLFVMVLSKVRKEDCQPVEMQLKNWMVAMPMREVFFDEHSRLPTCRVYQRYDNTRRITCLTGVGATNASRHLPENGRTFSITVRATVGSL